MCTNAAPHVRSGAPEVFTLYASSSSSPPFTWRLQPGAMVLCSVSGGSWGSSWGPFGTLLGPSWAVLGTFWAVLGRLGSLWASWGSLGGLLGPLGSLFGPSWGSHGPSWGPLGPSWGPLGGLMGRHGTILGASWAVLDAVKTKQTSMLKLYVFRREWDDVCLVEVFSGASWGVFGAFLGHLEAI